jgi:cell wall-associated NlpC family hydrolase
VFDCSGLVYRVYQQAGLLRKIGGKRMLAASYYRWFKQRGLVSRSNPQVGDVVWWTHHGRISHTGLYVGGGKVISALINPWGVKRTSLRGIRVKFLAFGHVRLGV